MSKKTEKPIKPEKNNQKNWTVKKHRLNRLKFWKNRPVQFGFISMKPKKPNRTQTEKNPEKNRVKPVWTGFCPKKPNRTETRRFEPVSVFFFKKISLVIFLDKNITEPKIINPKINSLSYIIGKGKDVGYAKGFFFFFSPWILILKTSLIKSPTCWKHVGKRHAFYL